MSTRTIYYIKNGEFGKHIGTKLELEGIVKRNPTVHYYYKPEVPNVHGDQWLRLVYHGNVVVSYVPLFKPVELDTLILLTT